MDLETTEALQEPRIDSDPLTGTPVPGGSIQSPQAGVQELLGVSEQPSLSDLGEDVLGWEDVRTPSEDFSVVEEVERNRPEASFAEAAERAGKDRPVWLRVWDNPMSPGTRARLLAKARRLELRARRRPKRKHHNTRRKERREKYFRCQREGKLRRDRWLQSCPEGLYKYYKAIAKRKGVAWRIEEQAFIDILNTTIDNIPIYKYIFNIYRIDKNKDIGYTISNITIVDRYSNKILYRYI